MALISAKYRSFVFLTMFACLPTLLHGQVDTGQILGAVTDQQGAAIAGATVTLTNTGTNAVQTQVTGSQGNYQFSSIQVGNYTLSAEASGFARTTQTGLTLSIQQNLVANITLNTGTVQSTVEVTTAPAALQTEDASVGAVVAQKTINNLPLNGRNFTFLAQLSAGVTTSQQDTRGLAANGGFSANGTPPNQQNYLLDGVDNNSNLIDYLNGAFYVYLPSPDSLGEFKVQTSNFSAEFGRASGAVLNATSKSGTDSLHGNLFEFLRNDALDARNYFEVGKKGEFRLNQFGATIGGPIVFPHIYDGRKHKTYFFGDYEGTRIVQASPITSTVPTALERSSNYTNLSELISDQSGTRTDILGRTFALGQVFDPSTTRQLNAGQNDPYTGKTATAAGYVREPFAGNLIPNARLDPNGVALLNVYPAPNATGLFSNYTSAPNLILQSDQGDVRIDQVTGEKGQVFGRASYLKQPATIPPPFTGLASGGAFATGIQSLTSEDDVVGWTRLLSPTLVNESRVGYSRIGTARVQPYATNLGVPAQFGIQGIPAFPNNGGLPTYNLAGLSQLGASPWMPTSETGTVFQVTENITKNTGLHSFKGGFEYQRVDITFFQPAYSRGNYTAAGTYTDVANTSGGSATSNSTLASGGGNTGLAQLLLTPIPGTIPGALNYVGGFNEVQATNHQLIDTGRNYYAFYGQDDWKLSHRLTLNLGLRWEFIGGGKEGQGRQVNFIPPTGSQGAEFLMRKGVCNQNLSTSFLALTAKDGISIACSSNEALIKTPWTDFAPRVGFAYQALNNVVIRSAYGIFYGAASNGFNFATANNYPFSFGFTYNSPDAGHPITFPNGGLATLETGLSSINFVPQNVNAAGLGLSGTLYNFKTPYYQAYNFSIENQISPSATFTVGFVGNQGRHLLGGPTVNGVSEMLPPAANPQNYVPYPDFSRGFGVTTGAANSGYNSLQTTIQRRMSNGLNLLANYTWSKCRTDYRDGLNNNIGAYRASQLPGFGIKGDYTLCDYHVPHMFHFSGTYPLPFGKGQKFLGNASGIVNQVVGGWTTNWIVTEQSGQPFTVSCTITTAASFGCYAPTVKGQSLYGPLHNVTQWANPLAFRNPAPATTIGQSDYTPLGGIGSQLLGPGFHRADLSFLKQFPVTEEVRFEFRGEIFNLFNTPQFGIPGFSGPGVVAAPGSTDFTNTANFGRITATRDGAYDQREVQVALKLYW